MRSVLTAFCLILLGGFVYLNSFPGAFQFDDHALLLENPRITSESFDYAAFLSHYGGRPLTLLSFHWNHQAAGQDPFTYHLVNVILHLSVGLLLYFVVGSLFKNRFAALAAAVIFLVHPLQSQAVNYIWSRSVLFMAVFGLLALWAASRKYDWTALICFQLAVWSRADGLILIVPLLVIMWPRWKAAVLQTTLNSLLIAGFLFRYAPDEMAWNHSGPVQYWGLQGIAFWKYVWMMLWPSGFSIDHDLVSPGWGWMLAAAAGILILPAAAWLLWERARPAAIGLGWTVLALLPSLLVPNSDAFNESRAYVALAGFALAAGWALASAGERVACLLENRDRIPLYFRPLALALLLILFVPVTIARNEIWKSDLVLWKEAVEASPRKARTHYNLGVALARRGHVDEAVKWFTRALVLEPEQALHHAGLAYCAEIRGNFQKAASHYRQAVWRNPADSYARQGLLRLVQYGGGPSSPGVYAAATRIGNRLAPESGLK